MKIRIGFVSNSSSSSFLIASNDDLEEVLRKIWNDFFNTNEDRIKFFIDHLFKKILDEIKFEEITHETWDSLKNFEIELKERWVETSDIEFIWKPLFEKWKYVHELTIPDRGQGGSHISEIIINFLSKSFSSKEYELKKYQNTKY